MELHLTAEQEVMLGASAVQVGKEVVSFALGANNAKTDADLDEAGKHFAKAVVLGGVAIISALFFKAKPKVFDEPTFKGSFPRPYRSRPQKRRRSLQAYDDSRFDTATRRMALFTA